MKSIAIITYVMTYGGCENVVATLANGFIDQGYQCSIITLMNDKSPYSLDERVYHFRTATQAGSQGGLNRIKCCYRIRKEVIRLKPDRIIIMPEEISCIMIPFLIGIKIPITVSERNNPWVRPEKKVNRLLRWIFYRFADGYVFQTQKAKAYFSKKIQEKSCIILNPLDITRLPHDLPAQREKIIVSIGRLEAQKNHALLINAFAKFVKLKPQYKLHIYGNGSEKLYLSNLASEILPNGTYSFFSPKQDVWKSAKYAEIFVLSSDYEGLPNALIEAMAMGLPCISTDCPVGGPAELITDGCNGVLIPTGSEDALVNAMLKIVSDQEFSSKIATNAIQIRKRVGKQKIVEEWLQYLLNIQKDILS